MMNQPSNETTDEKTSIYLLSGFLGAGKTTLLKRILSWESDLSDTVVLVNEFGEVGIDGALLKDSGSDVVELTSGCICCTLSIDLKHSLERIYEQFHPRRIFIEATGIADPEAVVTVLRDAPLDRYMSLEKVITVVDADIWEHREHFGWLFLSQLESAHLILLNKVDEVDEEKIPQFLADIHEAIPDCQVVPTVHCRVDPETLWHEVAPKGLSLKPMNHFHPVSIIDPSEGGHEDEACTQEKLGRPNTADSFVTFSFEDPRAMDEEKFGQFVDSLAWEVFRMKGPVQFPDRTEMINFVGGKSERFPWDGEGGTRLAFIGWNIDADSILEQLGRCIR